jgi:protein-tyrosine phosphatase
MPFAYIIDNIYLGDIFSSGNTELLSTVKNIFSLCPNPIQYSKHNHYKFVIEDDIDENIIEIAEKIYPLIEDGSIPTLIHCQAGRSRSASVVIYYLMKKYGKSFEDAYDIVNDKKEIGLNSGFDFQLRKCVF